MRQAVQFAAWIALSAASAIAAPPDFDREVAPILAGRCLDCHSGSEPKGGLALTSLKRAEAGGDSGSVLVAGKPEESLLWQRIDAGEMPPKHPLPPAEREVLKRWIEAGATWGTDPIDPFRYTSASRAGYDWWSLQPLHAAAPRIQNSEFRMQNGVDAFIVAALKNVGLSPSPRADRRTLLRRAAYDLTGLPPTPEELRAFEAAQAPDAFEREIDRLLASPDYAERWARHWLDVAHFGESDGFEFDRMRPHAWRYRDWVIDALNRDLPYDEFGRLQIAGDVQVPQSEDALIATGFLVGGAHDSLLPKGEVMRLIMRQDELEDLVGLVGQTFLGLTVHCARCHDHKFDPIRQADYFRLAAALGGVKRGNRKLEPQSPPLSVVRRQQAAGIELAALERSGRERVLGERARNAERRPDPPQPIAQWEFDIDLTDSIGQLDGAGEGNARLEGGALLLDGKSAYVVTPPLSQDLTAKTLEVWLRLDNLDQRGGGAITVESQGGDVFDSIVFGEREPRRWLAGSDFFRRTEPFADAADENDAQSRTVHLAMVYAADGTITAYRDGQPYGKSYKITGPAVFAAGKSRVVFGLRHSPAGGNKLLAGRIERASLYDRALTAAEVAASMGSASTFVSEAELAAALNEAERDLRATLQAEIARLDATLTSYKDRQAFVVTAQAAPVTHLLIRGNPQQPAEVIAPGAISALGDLADVSLPADAADAERRRALASWIADESNPLFARTIINRLWHYHFGRGLVETPSDLGFSGGEPSHPELLDWLARELPHGGWSLKRLHRVMVQSATYQQSSRPRSECLAVDVDNRLLWRYAPRRLEAEAVRDAMLLVAGELNRQRGGPSYMDFRPYEHKTAQYYEPRDDARPEVQRRSIYRFWARGGKNPLLDTFDCPDPSTATPDRPATTTPLQALVLLNNSFTLRMADAMAERLRRERPEDSAGQVALAFERCYGRLPAEEEAAAAVSLVNEHGLAPLCRVLLNANGFLYVH